MIDPTKRYKTRDGAEVRIYAFGGGGARPVHGAYKYRDRWEPARWTTDGRWYVNGSYHPNDLLEAAPKLTREMWVNVYRHSLRGYPYRNQAEGKVREDSIACVRAVIEYEEGEGL